MNDLIYKSANDVVLTFSKNDVWHWRSMSSFSEEKITFECDSHKYNEALRLKKAGKDKWALMIDWSSVIMDSKEEAFTVVVLYSGTIKRRQQVKVTYTQAPISINDFDISLSKNQSVWGTAGEVCSLKLRLKSDLKQWMFKDTKCTVQFKYSYNKGFFPKQGGDTVTFDIKESYEIPLIFKGYDEPINTVITERIFFAINGIDCSIPPEFSFDPRPYSYKAEVIGLQDRYQYGSENRIICQIQLVRTDVLSPIAESVELLSLSPINFHQALECHQNTHDNTEWDVVVKSDTSFNKLSNLDNKKISIAFGIDKKCDCTATASFTLGSIDKGLKPDIGIEPSDGLSLHKGDKDCSFKLIVTNRCYAKVFINKIDFKEVPADLLKIKEKVSKEIPPQGELTYTVLVNTAECFYDNVQISVSTSDTEPATYNYPIQIKQRPNARVYIKPVEDDQTIRRVIGRKYKKDDYFVKCEIGYSDDSPNDSRPIDLSKIDLGDNFCIDPLALEDNILQFKDYRIVDILFKKDLCVKKDDTIEEETDTGKDEEQSIRLFECPWNYPDQHGEVVNVPFIMPELYFLDIHNCPEQISFPFPSEKRVVLIDKFVVEEDGNYEYWDSNQKVITESPFSFSEENIETEKEMVPDPEKPITVYLHINEIEGIKEDTVNIKEKKDITYSLKIKGDNDEFDYGDKKLCIEPYSDEPELRISFRTKTSDILLEKDVTEGDDNERENEGIESNSKQPATIRLRVNKQDETVTALIIGELVFDNVQKIPNEDKQIGIQITRIGIYGFNMEDNLCHESTIREKNSKIIIPNGGPEQSIKLNLDPKKLEGVDLMNNLQLDIDICLSNFDDNGMPIESAESYYAEFKLELEYDFDDVYALDLGTTGIVLAKETAKGPKCVLLKDFPEKLDPIESKPEILSAHTMIIAPIKSENNSSDTNESAGNDKDHVDNSKITLAPSSRSYYSRLGEGSFRLVPSKFIIGQDHIPFLSNFYKSDKISSKTVQAFSLNETIDLGLEDKSDEEKEATVSNLIAALYREIFSRCDQEVEKIKKLVVTYPNTYSIDNLDQLRTILMDRLNLQLNGQISFVPESDAVAAYYFRQMMYSLHQFQEKESVVFYDMGAGTLDLSLVSFKKEGDGFVASIINKIGVPLAGNYLDYIIYNTLLTGGYICKNESDEEIGPNAIKDMTKEIKENFGEEKNIKVINPVWLNNGFIEKGKKDEIEKKTYKELIADGNEPYNDFLEACTSTALECLIPEEIEVHTIVFSGRGSKFHPIKDGAQKALKELMKERHKKEDWNIKIDELKPIAGCGDFMKTCVALGALRHQTFISGNYQMVNKNLFSKIAVVYFGKSSSDDEYFDVQVKYLVDPQDKEIDWVSANIINGTRCREFDVKETISHYAPGDMYYIQTCLPENKLKELYRKVYQEDPSYEEDLNFAFVNQLSKLRVLGSEPIAIKLKISEDNKIVEREIGNEIRSGQKLLENIEDNIIYKRSMWPFIVTEL